jgi:hypothetical protein
MMCTGQNSTDERKAPQTTCSSQNKHLNNASFAPNVPAPARSSCPLLTAGLDLKPRQLHYRRSTLGVLGYEADEQDGRDPLDGGAQVFNGSQCCLQIAATNRAGTVHVLPEELVAMALVAISHRTGAALADADAKEGRGGGEPKVELLSGTGDAANEAAAAAAAAAAATVAASLPTSVNLVVPSCWADGERSALAAAAGLVQLELRLVSSGLATTAGALVAGLGGNPAALRCSAPLVAATAGEAGGGSHGSGSGSGSSPGGGSGSSKKKGKKGKSGGEAADEAAGVAGAVRAELLLGLCTAGDLAAAPAAAGADEGSGDAGGVANPVTFVLAVTAGVDSLDVCLVSEAYCASVELWKQA